MLELSGESQTPQMTCPSQKASSHGSQSVLGFPIHQLPLILECHTVIPEKDWPPLLSMEGQLGYQSPLDLLGRGQTVLWSSLEAYWCTQERWQEPMGAGWGLSYA